MQTATRCLTGLMLSCAIPVATIQAQSVSDSTVKQLSEVTIKQAQRSSINKINVPIRDLPLTTTAVTARTIEQRGPDDLGEAMKSTTGVRANNTYGGFQHFTIRGFNNFVLLVDGVRDERHNLSTSAPSTNLANVERIEVLKGPASVLFGHSALGGIINIVRKRPGSEQKADFSASYGSFNTRRMRVGAGGALSKNLFYRVDAGLSATDGYRHAGVNTNNASIALAYTPTSHDNFYLTIGANKDHYDTDAGIPMLAGGKLAPGLHVNTRYNDPGDFLNNTNTNYQLRYTHQFSEALSLSDQLSYSDDNIDYLSTEALTFNEAMDSLTRTSPLYFNHLTRPLQNQLELTCNTHTGTIEHKMLVGYSYSHLDRKTYSANLSGDGLYATVAVQNSVLNQGNIAYTPYQYKASVETVHGIYVQEWIKFSDKLKGLAGLRYDIFGGTYFTNRVDKDRHVTESGTKTKIPASALTYRAGLVYQPLKAWSVYGSYSTYFKPSRRIANNGETFEPENGYQGEVGTRYDITANWSVNGSLYYMRKNNQVESIPGGSYRRVGAAASKGFEIELQGSPLAGLDVNAGYSYTLAKYLPYADKSITNSTAGKIVALAPKHMVNLWANYQLKGWSMGAGGNYMSDTYTNSANTFVLPAYTTIDAALGYQLGKVGLRLNVSNVGNRKYYANAIYSSQFYPGATRNYLLTLKYSL